jgi:hypothetical protein
MKLKSVFSSFRLLDGLLVFFLLLMFVLAILNHSKTTKANQQAKVVSFEIVVPNLEEQVAKSIQIADLIVDQNGKPVFEIVEKVEKMAEHPVIDQKGNLVISKHPTLKSLFLLVESLQPMKYSHGIKYNWQVVKVGGSLIWETKLTRFVGLVRTLNF